MTADYRDRREDVRGSFPYFVKYKIITQEEFKSFGNGMVRLPDLIQSKFKIDPERTDNNGIELSTSDSVINFLFQMDQKLDRILSLLLKDEDIPEDIEQGIGRDISASGMNMIVDQAVVKGQIVQAHIILSQIPFIGIDAFGEVVRTIDIREKDGSRCQIAIKFLNLNVNESEKIIAHIFQMQRKAARETKIAATH
jgi:hypothetical protein